VIEKLALLKFSNGVNIFELRFAIVEAIGRARALVRARSGMSELY